MVILVHYFLKVSNNYKIMCMPMWPIFNFTFKFLPKLYNQPKTTILTIFLQFKNYYSSGLDIFTITYVPVLLFSIHDDIFKMIILSYCLLIQLNI